MKLANYAACFAIAAFAFAPVAQAEVLSTNNGFEGPIGAIGEGTPDQWNPFVGPGAAGAGQAMDSPFEGAAHVVATLNGEDPAGAANSFAGFQYQLNGITIGEDYTFGFQARSLDPSLAGINGEFRIEWLDSTGAFVGGQFDNNVSLDSVTDTYAPFQQTRTAPTGAESLRAVFAVQSFGSGVDGTNSDTGTLFVDAAFIDGPAAIPEPSTLSLLGLAACGLVGRRRR